MVRNNVASQERNDLNIVKQLPKALPNGANLGIAMVLPCDTMPVCPRAGDFISFKSWKRRERSRRTAVIKSKAVSVELLSYGNYKFE